MSTESVAQLFDEVLEYVGLSSPEPPWDVCARSRGRLYEVSVEIAEEVVVDVSARALADAHRKALVEFRRWADDQSRSIEHALEVSIEEARAERAAGLAR